MTEANHAQHAALAAIIDRHLARIMKDAVKICAFPATSLRSTILQAAAVMGSELGRDAVAAYLRAVADTVESDTPVEALDIAGARLDQIEDALAERMQGAGGRA